MNTFQKLVQLNDGQFHRLCDCVLRRVEPRYRHLRPHGINDNGQSVKGQPDSYVGNTATACQIAFCYTTQRSSWWTKIISDVKEARENCPNVEEIVIALPRDVDREKPKNVNIDWLSGARVAAHGALVTVYDGRHLSTRLDEDYQDIRYEFLGIPYSRLSANAISASCRKANRQTIDDLRAKGRYDSDGYVVRDADHDLRRIWQEAISPSGACRRRDLAALIPIVSDSGFGKTSLMCAFAESSDQSLPVLLLQARDCVHCSEDALVRIVIQRMQGILSPSCRVEEELAITSLFSQSLFLTVLLDGLDEARDVVSVRIALSYWLQSRIGQASVLITSSRPDFWRRCRETSWIHYIPQTERGSHEPAMLSKRCSKEQMSIDGIALPGPFSPDEMRIAWVQAGGLARELDSLPDELRQDLNHPFNLRACLEVLRRGGTESTAMTRAEIISMWLRSRLETESDCSTHISCSTYWKALTTIAREVDAAGGVSVDVDHLRGVPRFDSARPPGAAVERLIAANILEFPEGQQDRLRFVFDAVYEFFLAEGDVEELRASAPTALRSLTTRLYSEVCTRLEWLGRQLAGTSEGDEFVKRMATEDSAKGLIMLQARPHGFAADTREHVVECVEAAFRQSNRVDQVFFIEKLGSVACEETRALLGKLVMPPENCPKGAIYKAAHSAIRLGCAEAIPTVAACWWLEPSRLHSYYHREILSLIRGAEKEFQDCLAEYCLAGLGNPSGSRDHVRAVNLLGYLGDNRLVEHLRARFEKKGYLEEYENHSLIALGSETAADLFLLSARATAAQMAKVGDADGGSKRYSCFLQISSKSYDTRYLLTPAFETCLITMMDDADKNISHMGADIALTSARSRLLQHLLYSSKLPGFFLGATDICSLITASDWLAWWDVAPSEGARKALLSAVGDVLDIRIENRVLPCLHEPELRWHAVTALGKMGSVRCAADLRELLQQNRGINQEELGLRYAVVMSLGKLRDAEAIDLIENMARTEDSHLRSFALDALARIGSDESRSALLRLSEEINVQSDEVADSAAALIADGSSCSVAAALKRAQERPDGPTWLVKAMSHAFMVRGHRAGEYYTHVDTRALMAYIAPRGDAMSPREKRDLIWAVSQIDSEDVRHMLRNLASQAGTDRDPAVRDDGLRLSSLAHEQLMHRGDSYSVPFFVSEAVECDKAWFSTQMKDLEHFSREVVAAEVRQRLVFVSSNPAQVARLLALLGEFGISLDAETARPFLSDPHELVRNVAHETLLRLTDPLRLARNWREILAWPETTAKSLT